LKMNIIKILIVEDEQIVAKNIEKRLTAAGYQEAASVSTGEEAIEKVKSVPPDIILMDIKLKGKIDGIETADILRKNYQLPVIFLTSYTDEETFQRAKNTEPFGYLIKPFETKDLNRAVELALYKNKIYQELLETKLRFEIAIKAGNMGVWEFWPTEKKYFSDKNLKTLYRFDENELTDNIDDWSALVYKDDREKMSSTFDNFLSNKGQEFTFEHRVYRKDGSIGWVVDHGLLFDADDDKPLRLIGTTTDITERKEAEIELQKSEEKFRNVFEGSGIGMAILSLDGHFTKVNRVFCKMLEYREKEILNLNFRDITHPGDIEKSIGFVNNLLKSETWESSLIEKRYLTSKGEIIWALTTVSLMSDFEGKPLYFIVQVQDITKRKRNEEQILRYAEELKSLNAAKDKFFSIIAHDLRSPFNSLLGLTEFITHSYDEMNSSEIKSSILNIYNSAQQVYNLILNLLEWSMLQSGRLKVEKSVVNLAELGLEIINLYKESADNKQLELINNISENILVYADKYMIDTIIRNFVSNSIKFTNPGGQIIIKGIINGDNAEVSVTDTGIGISLENQKNLFRIDEQFRRDGTASEKGTGLGLILCKEFIEKNSGVLWVESEEGKGSRFSFTVPRYVGAI
ncbi:MAG: PAS domain S-box protein, partial [Ignavibacteriaceae bacterium]|nr:PAS domain S-box protein [Ignavibacteriaceae bacterium]